MRSDQQPGDTGTDDSGFGGPPLGGPGFSGKGPWFGRKRFGYGYGPRTWQGWLLTAVLLALVITAGSIAPKSPLFYAAVAAAIVVPFAVMAIQHPR